MMMFWYTIVLAFIVTHNSFCRCDQEYVVMNEDISSFPGGTQTLVDFRDLKTVKRERFLNGSMIFKEDMTDDDFKLGVDLYSSPERDGNYKRLPAGVPPTGVCEAMKKFYTQFVQPAMRFDDNTNFPIVPDDEGLCPFPAGSYFISMLVLDTESWPNDIPRGLLKIVITFYKDETCVGGMSVVIRVDDK